MRMIDADYAEKMLRSLGNRAFRRENGTIMDAIKMISNPSCTPTVDAAEVLRGMWISVNDRLTEPKEIFNKNSEDEFSLSDPVLTFGKHGFAIATVERYETNEIFETFDGSVIADITHWMPLPPPQEEGKT